MPETSIYKDAGPVLPQYQVRMSGQPLVVQTITESPTPQPFAHNHLRLRVLRPNRRHIGVPPSLLTLDRADASIALFSFNRNLGMSPSLLLRDLIHCQFLIFYFANMLGKDTNNNWNIANNQAKNDNFSICLINNISPPCSVSNWLSGLSWRRIFGGQNLEYGRQIRRGIWKKWEAANWWRVGSKRM